MSKANGHISCLLLGGLLLVGCGESSPADTEEEELGHPPAVIVGTWTFQSVIANGAAAQLADALEWLPATVRAKLHVQANGPYVYEEVNATGGQLWFESGWVFVDVEGGTIDLHAQLDGDGPVDETIPLTYTLAGGVLTLTRVEGGTTFVFTLTMP